ncbi:hypothetical protein Cadr_000027888 [Camelus dromedarius]|uniref:Uncharacterized protein n=1 Tax=Camelus dromedarius TaxID=9838 RepID=A0A5N4C8M0_CAMDR|nr:hypothetical protein Cadr_000027888 [Camelus dromedarius]
MTDPMKITRNDFLPNQTDGTEPDWTALRRIINVKRAAR